MKLSDLCNVYSGYALKNFNSNGIGVPVIKIGNINSVGNLNLNNCQYTTDEVNEKYFSKYGDIYVALSGATTGKTGIMVSNEKYIINQRVGIIRCIDTISYEFIKYFLIYKTDEILAEASGCAQPNISPKQLAVYELPNYSIEKMCVIANKLNRIKSIINKRQQELDKLDELVKARFVEMFGDAKLNPNGYPIKALSEISVYWNGLTYKPEDVSEKGTIVLRSSNIQNSRLDFDDVVRVSCKIGEKKFVQENDVLMCSRNGSARLVGKVALIKEIIELMSFGAFMMIIRSQYYPYLLTYFQMPAFREQIATGATTTINQITTNMLNKVKLPVPNVDTINQFANFVKQIDKSKVAAQKALDKTQ